MQCNVRQVVLVSNKVLKMLPGYFILLISRCGFRYADKLFHIVVVLTKQVQ